ncbi:leucine-rich repeat extensin-like protein 3 [Iris pallida]|uniref:Leucine-rich repeat extensin-like protein 3 n=1 Tax=Iris pallida TaxID=29817 RepID=A0AAX6H5N6_IRIPA|nr:leucine-rich repeat extensin-like protein 3 [Iris pallida]
MAGDGERDGAAVVWRGGQRRDETVVGEGVEIEGSSASGNRGKLGLVSGGRRRWVLGGAGEKKRRGRLQAELDAARRGRRARVFEAVGGSRRGEAHRPRRRGNWGSGFAGAVKGFRRRGHGGGRSARRSVGLRWRRKRGEVGEGSVAGNFGGAALGHWSGSRGRDARRQRPRTGAAQEGE